MSNPPKTTYHQDFCSGAGQLHPQSSLNQKPGLTGEPAPGWVLSTLPNVRDQITTIESRTASGHQQTTTTNMVVCNNSTLNVTNIPKPIPNSVIRHPREYVQISAKLQEKFVNANHQDPPLFYYNKQNHDNSQPRETEVGKDNTWNNLNFVRLPLSSNFSKMEASQRSNKIPKWIIIQDELKNLHKICTNPENRNQNNILNIGNMIQKAITQYNKRSIGTWNFDLLKEDFDLAKNLFETLPIIIEHALRLEVRLSHSIPLLKKGINKTLYFSRNLICSIVANFFFCTFPEQNADIKDFNFVPMFNKSGNLHKMPGKIEKLKCILEYFKNVGLNGDKDSIISYQRRCIRQREVWSTSQKEFCKVGVRNGKIENADNMLQVDFANKFVGGGVLNEGLVMEEIRFVICPELLASRLFTERLEDDEVLVITGVKQYSAYTGYGSTFKFKPLTNKNNGISKDHYGRDAVQVVAMDAIHFRQGEEYKQFAKHMIDRELHKCRVAFHTENMPTEVATGNWGCGAFNGDPELKFVIQWIAASHVGRPGMIYHTLQDRRWEEAITEIYKRLRKGPVAKVYKILIKYQTDMQFGKHVSLFTYLKSKF